MSATDNFLQSLKQKGGARVGTMLALDPRTPDDTAEAMRVGGELGLPANVVAADPMGFKRQLDQKKNTTALTGAPKTAKWLQDINNGALAKDDVDNLTWFEKSMLEYKGMGEGLADTQTGRGLRTGVTGVQKLGVATTALSAQGNAAQNRRLLDLYGRVGEADQSLTVEEMAETLGINPMSVEASFAHGFLTSNAETRQQYVDAAIRTLASDEETINAVTESVKSFSAEMEKTQGRTPNFTDIEDISSFADWFAFNTGQAIPFLAVTALAGLVGGPPGALASGYAMGVGDINAEMLEQGITDQPNNAIVGGVPYAGLELLGPAARPFRNVSGSVLENVAESYFKRAAKEVPANVVEEFINEAGQEIIKDLVVADAGGEEVTLDNETLLKWFNSGMAGAASGAAVSAVSTAMTPTERQLQRDMQAAGNSGKTAAAIDELDRMAAASKLKQRSPEKFAEALDAQGEADFYVAAEDLREYFQAKDVPFDDETLRAWGVEPNDFAQAEAAGGDVTVPRSAYAARISGTEDAAWFRDNATTEPGEMSVSQATRFNSEVREVMERAIEDAEDQRAREIELRASDVQVYDSVFSQLREAGRTRDVADNEARVWSSFWRTMAERYGGDPLDLAQSMGVQIRGPQTPETSRRRNDLDIKLNTLRSNPQKALKPEGQDLLSFIRDKGGVSDTGGDLAAMDAPKGIIGETREQFEARRGQPGMFGPSEGRAMGLDELGRAAIEAGYFPELMGGADIQMDGTVVDEAAVLLEALQRAISGEAIYVDGQGPNPDMVALSDQLSQLGLDISEMSNDEIAAALEGGGQTFDQNGNLRPDSAAFKAWAGTDAPVLYPDEINETDFSGQGPWVMRAWHGTTHDFEAFDASVRGNREGQFGAVNYFSSSKKDASGNYGADGQDLTNRIEQRAERLQDKLIDQFEEKGRKEVLESLYRSTGDLTFVSARLADMDDSDAAMEAGRVFAQQELKGGTEKTLGVFIRTEKPFVVGGDDSPFIDFADFSELEAQAIARVADDEGMTVQEIEDARDDYEDQIDEARWDLEAETDNPLYEAVQSVADRYEIDASALLSDLSEIAMEGSDHNALEQVMRNSESLVYAEDPEDGGLIGYHVLAEIVEALGFDSIIMKNADVRFPNMGIEQGTAHVHVFDSHNSNIKSVDNTGAFSRDDPRIMFQTVPATDTPAFREWFGDSKVVDADGNPLVVYHGTAADFEAFDKSMAGSLNRNETSKEGFFFTSRPTKASNYADPSLLFKNAQRPDGANVIAAYVSVKNPKVFTLDATTRANVPEELVDLDRGQLVREAKAEGHDGVIVRRRRGDEWDEDFVIAFDPAQIKSVNNRGTFDRNDARILYQGDMPSPESGEVSGVPFATNLARAFEMAMDGTYTKGRQLKVDLQERSLEAQREAGIDLTTLDDENIDRLADFVVEDAREALRDNSNAIGWYDRTVTRALETAAEVFPEILTNPTNRLQFTWAMAVTSNGLKVDKNFEVAGKAYEALQKTGRFPKNAGIGQAAAAINGGLAQYHTMLEKFGGDHVALTEFMNSKVPVREIEKEYGVKISGEGKGTLVRGASILGPKIGNGFFSNLYGNFDELTMDRWLMRSVGRWRGTLIERKPEMEAKKRGEIKDTIGSASAAELKAIRALYKGGPAAITKNMTATQINVLAVDTAKRSMDPAWRTKINETAAGQALRKSGNGLAKYLDGQVEAPAGASERTFIRNVFQKALIRLQDDPAVRQQSNADLTMSDLQALLWYPEKRLYDTAKSSEGESRGYEDEDAPDYANAARKFVNNRLGRTGRDGQAGGRAADDGRGVVAVDGSGASQEVAGQNDARTLYQADPADVDAFVSGLKSRLGLRDLSMFVSGGDLQINMIAVERDGQKKGTGSKAMAEIADFADKHSMRLTLTTGQRDDGFGTTSQSRLKRFYKRFGFVENKGRNKDFSISGNMYREPRLYQGEQTKRGSIRLPSGGLEDGQTVITLFESANLSTFLHESGHFFLEAFTALATSDTAPQAMKDDLAAIHKFLKVDGSAPLTTAQHEMWARGFEAYAMEGKAPSLELADAFGRFKSWLTRIYRSIKGLNVKLTPEIREVMDRMLATDAEIAAARETQQMSPLFTDETASGMSPAAWKTYQRMARRSEEQATQALLEKTMAKVRREKETWWKEERAQVRKEVENTVNSEPRYRLIEMLANQKWIGSDDAVPDFQLDRQELVDTFGDGVLAELSRSRFGGERAIYGADGISLHEAAEFFGFANPVAMVEALQNTGKKKDTIDLETDRIMSDRYGDPLNDGSIEEDALAAIHSEQQAQTVAAEARHLAGRAGRSTRNMTAKVFRQRARMMLSRMSVKDAIRPNAFLEAERKSARRAEDAFARVAGGREAGAALAAASKHKEQQMLNHYLYMESRDLAAMVASKREKMRAYNKKSVREKLDGGYIEQIDAILEGYDFRVRSPGQVQRSEKLRAFVERMIEDGREGELDIDARLLDEANRKHYTKLSVEELQGLFDTIDNIDHMGRFKQKLVDAKNKRDLQDVATTFANAISDRFGTGKAAKQSKQVRNFFNLLFSVDTMMVDLDGTEVGEVYDLFKAPLDRGQAQEQQMNVAMADAVQDIFSAYTSKELSQMQVAKVIPGGNGHAWSKMEIIGLALNTGNQDGRNRILEETVHPERRLTQDQLDATLDTLERADWDFVQSVINQVNSYWPELSETHKRRKGTTLKKVDAVPIETKFGTYAGGYYPISYDSQRSIGAAKDEASAWDQFTAAGRGSRIEVRSGMTNERQQTSGGRTVDFDLNVALRHMRDTIRVISMSEVVDNAARIIKHKDVETAFMDAGQTNQFNTLKLFLDDLSVGPVYNTDPINSFARIVKNNFTMSKLAFNFKTVALQVTGITQSAVVVGKKNMVRGYRDYLANPNAAVQMAMEKSTFMSERKTSFQKDIYDQINDIQLSSPLAKRTTKAKNELGKAGFYPMIRVQFLTVDVPTWIAAHDAKLREGASDDAAVKYADRIVARAQGSGLYADRNALERGTVAQNLRQSDFIRLWTTLGSYMVTKMNRGYLAAQKGKRGFSEAQNAGEMVGTAINLASDMALLYMAEAIMMGLAYALLAGDDADEEDLQKFVLTNTATSVIGGVPIVSGVANAFQGYGAGGVLASVLEMPANVSVQISQGENDAALWRSVADGTGMLTGLPSTASYRAIEGLVRGIDEGELPLADMFFGSNPLTR